jgi:hypothetical protein
MYMHLVLGHASLAGRAGILNNKKGNYIHNPSYAVLPGTK